jgi:hypothetical protein
VCGPRYASKSKVNINSQDQEPDQNQRLDQKLIAFKKLRFFQGLSVSKASRRSCFIHQNSTGNGVK